MIKMSGHIKVRLLIVMVTCCAPASLFSQEKEDLRLFNMWDSWGNGGMMLRSYLNEQAFYYLDKRDSLISTLHTEDDWKNRQEMVKKIMLTDIGAFPERTPLNARVVNIEKKDGYRMNPFLTRFKINL